MDVRNVRKPSDVIKVFEDMKESTGQRNPMNIKKCGKVYRYYSTLQRHKSTQPIEKPKEYKQVYDFPHLKKKCWTEYLWGNMKLGYYMSADVTQYMKYTV